LSLFLNGILFLDLYLVIKNPFAPQKQRLDKLLKLAKVLAILFTLITYIITLQPGKDWHEVNFRMFQGIAFVSVAVSIVLMIWVLWRFRKFNLSIELKKSI